MTAPEPRLGTFSALRQRQFALLWFSGVGQSIGLGMQQIALGYFVYDETDSEFWVGAVAFMNFAPFFLFSPLAGVIGGGYGADVEPIARRHALLHHAAAAFAA